MAKLPPFEPNPDLLISSRGSKRHLKRARSKLTKILEAERAEDAADQDTATKMTATK
jgi:hypothetical protein